MNTRCMACRGSGLVDRYAVLSECETCGGSGYYKLPALSHQTRFKKLLAFWALCWASLVEFVLVIVYTIKSVVQ